MTAPQRYVSDELTHFVGRSKADDEARYALLLSVLQNGFLTSDPNSPAFRDRLEGLVVVSYTPHAPFSDPDSYAINCVCFCDIPVPDLPLHMAKYSRFGLALSKPFLVAKGANPAFYWSATTPARGRPQLAYLDDMVGNFHWLMDRLRAAYPNPTDSTALPEIRDRLERLFDFINRYMLCFTKVVDVTLPDDDPANVYMEREWRVAGNIAFDLADVQRVIIPRLFAERLRTDLPHYYGQVEFAD